MVVLGRGPADPIIGATNGFKSVRNRATYRSRAETGFEVRSRRAVIFDPLRGIGLVVEPASAADLSPRYGAVQANAISAP